MTLYDIVSKAQYMQVFSIYLTNAYDQNIPIARGTRSEMIAMDADENEEDFFNHLMCDVEYFSGKSAADAIRACGGIVAELPSVTPTRKKGKWIKSNIGGAKVCSNCQAHMGLSNFKFCPNCGAKMESEE